MERQTWTCLSIPCYRLMELQRKDVRLMTERKRKATLWMRRKGVEVDADLVNNEMILRDARLMRSIGIAIA